MTDPNELMSCKELAYALKRDVSYIYTMRTRGFRMVGDRATVNQALEWLASNPLPWSKLWGTARKR